MKSMNRRDLCVALSALAAMGSVSAEAQSGSAKPVPVLDQAAIFPFDKLPVRPSSNGGSSRPVSHGTLPTGEFVEVHETMLPPGQMPHPPHRHTHSEFLLIREGKVEAVGDGQRGVVEAGGVIFNASGVLHGIKNIGDVPANYFVVAIGIQKTIA